MEFSTSVCSLASAVGSGNIVVSHWPRLTSLLYLQLVVYGQFMFCVIDWLLLEWDDCVGNGYC